MNKTALLMTTTCLLAACAGDHPPAPSVAYVPATLVQPEPAGQPVGMPVPITDENPIPAPKVKEWKSAAAKTAAANKGSLRTSLEGEYQGAILNYEYQHGKRYRVVVDGPTDHGEGWGDDADATLITLGQDDGSEPSITQGGLLDWFNVDKVETAIEETSWRAKRDKVRAMSQGSYNTQITVSCAKRGARTSLKVGTGKRFYIFDLECQNSHGGNNYNHVVEFTYPHDQQISTGSSAPRAMTVQPRPIVADVRYTVEGPADWKPREWVAWNDGAKTYVRPAPSVQSRPVPMLATGTSFEVDSTTNEYIINGLPSEIHFPWSGSAIIVKRVP